jgi:hypothetical protein
LQQADTLDPIRVQIDSAVRRVLSETDRDPFAPTSGCMDRRYWAWKLVDMPDATLQRNVQALAAVLVDASSPYYQDRRVRSSLVAAIGYTAAIQRRDGSFDQAFPHERSVAATAFVLHALLDVADALPELEAATRSALDDTIARAANFLSKHDEQHGFIANHQAAVALVLHWAAARCADRRYASRAQSCLGDLLGRQSVEGWFPEYAGADPGYQTLCLYYLALLHRRDPSLIPPAVLARALDVVSYFVHPDGTFGGEYGSRRTAIFYPGGIALLQRQFPIAAAVTGAMAQSIRAGRTTTLIDIDAGNLAPLLVNYLVAGRAGFDDQARDGLIPWQIGASVDMPAAGLFVRTVGPYYSVFGTSNGGVLKVFDTQARVALCDDSGYVGQLAGGTLVTTQVTDRSRPVDLLPSEIGVVVTLCDVRHAVPAPSTWLLLRAASLSVLRIRWCAEIAKTLLVRLLITRQRRRGIVVRRRVTFTPAAVTIRDEIRKSARLRFSWLRSGVRFTAIHMASARYYEGALPAPVAAASYPDVAELNRTGALTIERVVQS